MAGEYDARFEAIVSLIIQSEGGYVDHPLDKGGPTNMGITMPFLEEAWERPVSEQNIKDLGYDDARVAYHKMVWQKWGVHRLPSELQYLMFDWMVMSGPGTPTKFLQRKIGTKADGIIGPKTAKAAQKKLGVTIVTQFKKELVLEIIRYFIGIARRDPTQLAFLEGWFNRISKHIV